jgi:hypothetical protein
VLKAHCNNKNLEGYAWPLFLYIRISLDKLNCFYFPMFTQMPQITPEDEEGACHSEAEAGDILSGTCTTVESRDPCAMYFNHNSTTWIVTYFHLLTMC